MQTTNTRKVRAERLVDLTRARELVAAGKHDEARVLFARYGIQLHTVETN